MNDNEKRAYIIARMEELGMEAQPSSVEHYMNDDDAAKIFNDRPSIGSDGWKFVPERDPEWMSVYDASTWVDGDSDEDIWAYDSGDTIQDNAIIINGVEYTDTELERKYNSEDEIPFDSPYWDQFS